MYLKALLEFILARSKGRASSEASAKDGFLFIVKRTISTRNNFQFL